MKKILWLLVGVFVVSLVPVGAGAVTDPTPDLLGVYFDANAEARDLIIGANMPFYMNVILTNPSAEQIVGFEFSYLMNVDPSQSGLIFLLASIPPPGINDVSLPVYDPLMGEVNLSWSAPEPTTTAMTLFTFQYMLLVPMTAHMTLGAVAVETIPDGMPSYWDSDNDFPMGDAGCTGLVNEFCPVAVEAESFGTVKALYR